MNCEFSKPTHGTKRVGIFKPKNLETLKVGLVPFIGQTMEVSYLWVCDEDEMFAGQVAWGLPDDVGRAADAFWAPDEDFLFVEEL